VQKENEELVRVSRFRSLFLARLAHELRTPLTSILGFSEILLNQEKLSEPQRNFCERIQNSAQQMQSSLNQLSDLARLEVGQTNVSCEEFSLGEALRELCDAVSRQAEKKSVRIELHSADNLPALNSDQVRLRRAIHNVLAYAIARSPQGAEVEVRANKDDEGFVLTIADQGEAVADPASIGTLNLESDKSSSGELGVALAVQNLKLLGATINGNNREVGVEITIRLPFNPPQAQW
jgi:signal transduction histidine kinase